MAMENAPEDHSSGAPSESSDFVDGHRRFRLYRFIKLSVGEFVEGGCQSKANWSPKFARQQVLGSGQFAPFEKGSVS